MTWRAAATGATQDQVRARFREDPALSNPNDHEFMHAISDRLGPALTSPGLWATFPQFHEKRLVGAIVEALPTQSG